MKFAALCSFLCCLGLLPLASNASTSSVLGRSPVVMGAVDALEEFRAGFESQGSVLGAELVGFQSRFVDGEVLVAVVTLATPSSVRDSRYACHFHGDAGTPGFHAHCHSVGGSETRSYESAPGSFTTDEFREAAESAVILFERAFGRADSIQDAKFWRSANASEPSIEVRLTWKSAEGGFVTNFLYCHRHGHGNRSEIDCHRQRGAGSHEA